MTKINVVMSPYRNVTGQLMCIVFHACINISIDLSSGLFFRCLV